MTSSVRRIRAHTMWWEGLRCGLLNACRWADGETRRHVLRLGLCPVDLWRYVEFPAVLDAYRGEAIALDVGSPKLLGLLLARRFGASVLVSDIVPSIGGEATVYQRACTRGHLAPLVADGTRLPLRSGSVPFVYSVSVVEHIGGEGDIVAMREMARVLQPGGRLVITVPVCEAYQLVWAKRDPYGRQEVGADGQTFFCRLYDESTVHERLVAPTGLRLACLRAWHETRPGWYDGWYGCATRRAISPRSIATKALDFHWARKRIAPAPSLADVRGRGVVALTFEKPGE